MFEDNKTIDEQKEFSERFDRFLSDFAEITDNPMAKAMNSVNKLNNKTRKLIDKKKIQNKEYFLKVYSFSEQLNKLVDEFIKEHK